MYINSKFKGLPSGYLLEMALLSAGYPFHTAPVTEFEHNVVNIVRGFEEERLLSRGTWEGVLYFIRSTGISDYSAEGNRAVGSYPFLWVSKVSHEGFLVRLAGLKKKLDGKRRSYAIHDEFSIMLIDRIENQTNTQFRAAFYDGYRVFREAIRFPIVYGKGRFLRSRYVRVNKGTGEVYLTTATGLPHDDVEAVVEDVGADTVLQEQPQEQQLQAGQLQELPPTGRGAFNQAVASEQVADKPFTNDHFTNRPFPNNQFTDKPFTDKPFPTQQVAKGDGLEVLNSYEALAVRPQPFEVAEVEGVVLGLDYPEDGTVDPDGIVYEFGEITTIDVVSEQKMLELVYPDAGEILEARLDNKEPVVNLTEYKDKNGKWYGWVVEVCKRVGMMGILDKIDRFWTGREEDNHFTRYLARMVDSDAMLPCPNCGNSNLFMYDDQEKGELHFCPECCKRYEFLGGNFKEM